MKYVKPQKLKVLMILFFGTGSIGIIVGLSQLSQVSLFITFMGVINICLGGFVGWIFLTQEPHLRDKRKK
jgi:hypothetical protein